MTYEPGISDMSPDPLDRWTAQMEELTFEDLAAALRAHAKGMYGVEAACELLIRHRTWLHRQDFRGYIEVGGFAGDELMAAIDWENALGANLPSSGSEQRILSLAASIASGDAQNLPPLGELLTGLDDANELLVLRAVHHASRGHEGQPVTVLPF